MAEGTREWGRLLTDELDPVVIVSPHFDDAVLGCSLLMAAHPGATVVTVMGGPPPSYPSPVSDWDAKGGFQPGDDVVAIRREEDHAALEVLGARHVWLDFVDWQYLDADSRTRPAVVADELERAILELRPGSVFFPFGMANPDHVVTHEAALTVRARHPELRWFCYEDWGYKLIPGLLAWRISLLLQAELFPTPAVVMVEPDLERKAKALSCYTSQLPPLRDLGVEDQLRAPVPEQYWLLTPQPPMWDLLAGTFTPPS